MKYPDHDPPDDPNRSFEYGLQIHTDNAMRPHVASLIAHCTGLPDDAPGAAADGARFTPLVHRWRDGSYGKAVPAYGETLPGFFGVLMLLDRAPTPEEFADIDARARAYATRHGFTITCVEPRRRLSGPSEDREPF